MSGVKRYSIFCLLLSSLLGGCAMSPVESWQRGQLASPEMAWEPDAGLADYRAHARFSKEGAFGRIGDVGGGCGCN